MVEPLARWVGRVRGIYAFSIVTNRFAALSIWVGVDLVEVVIYVMYVRALRWASYIFALPS